MTKNMSLRIKKLEIKDQTSSRGSGFSSTESVCFQSVETTTWFILSTHKFGPQSYTKVEAEPQAVYSEEKPFSLKQVDARLQQGLTEVARCTTTDIKSKKSLKFDSNVFLPSSTSFGGVKLQ